MNITPQVPNLSIPTVLNPHTESLRRENNQREIITQPAPTSQSAAEKGVASDKERSRTPAQNNANIDFARIREQAELANSSIAGQGQEQHTEQNNSQNEQENQHSQESKNDTSQERNHDSKSISGEEQTKQEALEQARVISELQKRDTEVRSHEAAHAAVGGSVTGSPSFSYEKGPDGKRYAVEGEVAVDLSIVKGDPRATIEKMQKVHAAALAPVNPSTQDRHVANTATQLILQAQSELLTEIGNKQDDAKTKNKVAQGEEASAAHSLSSESSDNLTARNETDSSSDFEVLINKTLKNQEKIAPSQAEVIVERALRIESFYAAITQAYAKPPSFNFELTV